jgi:signal transduction histidine kinase
VIFSATFYGVFLLARDIAKNQTALRKSQKLLETRVKERTIELENSVKKLLQTQEQLIESEKMASLGRLVAGIAHEINTPLGIAITAASHLEAETTSFNKKFNNNKMSKSELAKFIAVNKQCSDLVLSNLSRADELIISLKDISVDQSTEECRTINLKAYINEIILSLTPKIKNTKINVCVIGNESIKIKSIPGFIAQVITNLFMNAVNHAFQQKTAGNITITIKPLENNQAVNIIFSDDGCGISADIKDKIFEPFFTTNRAQGGTGLGLNIVYSLVTQKLKGSINCESTLGIGTQFIITLPHEIT